MGKTLIRIGIDPDLKASGFCVLVKQPFGTWQIQVIDTIPFFTLIEQIEAEYTASKAPGNDLTVCIEAGWLNKSIHHFAENKAIAGRIGKNVGHNEAIGKLIAEYCEINDINHKLIKPVSSKWNAELFRKITGWEKRTNQEERDAVRAAWV